MWLFVAFLLVPLIEIALFIQIGGWLTLWPTLAIVIATALLGTWVVREQGLRAMADLRGSLEKLNDPVAPLAHGAMILFAGALLLTPGFLTDAVGFLLLVPAVRLAIFQIALRRIEVRRATFSDATTRQRHPHDNIIIEPEFHEVDPPAANPPGDGPPQPPQAGRSGWSRH